MELSARILEGLVVWPTRYDRGRTVFLSAIALAAAIMFWLCALI